MTCRSVLKFPPLGILTMDPHLVSRSHIRREEDSLVPAVLLSLQLMVATLVKQILLAPVTVCTFVLLVSQTNFGQYEM
jgi:hypothetical protein